MYINPFERMKNLKLNTEETKPNNSKSNEQKMNSTQVVNEDAGMAVGLFKNSGHEIKKNINKEELGKIDGMVLSNYEIVRDLIKTFKEKK